MEAAGDQEEEETQQLLTLLHGKEVHKSGRSTPAEHIPTVKQYRCEDCGIEFPDSVENVRKHTEINHPRIVNQLPPSKTDLNGHMGVSHKTPPTNLAHEIQCNECDIPFSNENDKIGHINAMHKSVSKDPNPRISVKQVRNYNCRQCPYQGNSAKLLLNHVHATLHTNTDDLSVECYSCKLKCSNWREMMIHRRDKHNGELKLCKSILSGQACQYGVKCYYRHTISNNENNKVLVDETSQMGFQKAQLGTPPEITQLCQQFNIMMSEMMKMMREASASRGRGV